MAVPPLLRGWDERAGTAHPLQGHGSSVALGTAVGAPLFIPGAVIHRDRSLPGTREEFVVLELL